MRARLISEVERERFNEFIWGSEKGHVLQCFEWGELKSRTGWEPLRVVVEDGGRIRAAASILKRGVVLGRCIFYAPRGPVIDGLDAEIYGALLDYTRELAGRHRAIMLKIDPDIPVERREASPFLRSLGFVHAEAGVNFEGVQPRFVFRLSLEPHLEQIIGDFAPKTRYNIRLAERRGVYVKEGAPRSELPVFYRILQETALRDGFRVRSYDYYEYIWQYLVERGYARLFMAYYQGEALAGTLLFRFGDKAWYVYGASSGRHREVMPNHLLQWRMICWAKTNGCNMYDFRGVSGDTNPDNPLYGLYRFKKGFGGKFTEFIGEYDMPYNRPLYWAWRAAAPAYRRAREFRTPFSG